MKRSLTSYTLILFVLLFSLLATPFTASSAGFQKQAKTPQENAAATLQTMSPEEKIGQLFLITFTGSQAGPDSQIYDLINNHYIGGAVLLAENDNFTSGKSSLEQIQALNRQLQSSRWAAATETRTDPATNATFTPAFIPLFIGIPEEGDGYPYDQILHGVTPLPNQMALGATWNPDLAREVGKLLGQELHGLGFNLLLGPSLDVLEAPYLESKNNLGTRAFGGDPFWVGELGKAYVEGIHLGSEGKLAVSATHFPGHGGSDRPPEEEVATVRKSLEELKSFELAPFFSVTGNAPTITSTVDALLVSHIRYQGFQGNIRATTRPISFDPQAFSLLLGLPPIASWRDQGGVLISDNLGSKAVRRFYTLTNQTFDARRVALNAFLAGNDLLYMADFTSDDAPDQYAATLRTLEFFTQKYREDIAFAKRVDEAVLRILTLKYKLYGDFTLNKTLPIPESLRSIGQGDQIVFDVARDSATLISPSQQDLETLIPDPPNLSDRIVFITDSRTAQQCSQCPLEDTVPVNALENVVIRRYGPAAGGLISPANLASYSLADLEQLLAEPGTNLPIEHDLQRAHWIVFSLLNDSSTDPAYQTLSKFLSDRPELYQQKRVILFALNAPYYLDATDISKLTAYYGLYSKVSSFIDMASYLLFRELQPSGALPVSVPGVYDLNAALFPDPDQVIPLELDLPASPSPEGTSTPEPTPTPQYTLGDTIPLRTGIILDHNGHPVPDGTPVNFIIDQGTETIQSTTTAAGIARIAYVVNNYGTLEIRAESEPAKQSALLKIDIPAPPGEAGSVTPTQPFTPEPSPTVTSTAPAYPPPVPAEPPPHVPGFADWIVAIFVSAGIAWSFYRLAVQAGQVRWAVRGGFLALIGGVLAYIYLALQLPGSSRILETSVARGVFLITLAGIGLGLLATWIWRSTNIASSRGNNHASGNKST